MANEQCMMDI